jgi:hypothetical protein
VAHAVPFDMGIPRVSSILKLGERRDREQTLEDKVASVRALMDERAPGRRANRARAQAAATGSGAATPSSHASTVARSSSKPVRGSSATTAWVSSRQ